MAGFDFGPDRPVVVLTCENGHIFTDEESINEQDDNTTKIHRG